MRDEKKIGVKDYITFKMPARTACVVLFPRGSGSPNVRSLIDSFNSYGAFSQLYQRRELCALIKRTGKITLKYIFTSMFFDTQSHSLNTREVFNLSGLDL